MSELTDGDGQLCVKDKIYWCLVYHVLEKFGCPIIFKTYDPPIDCGDNRLISFYVPEDHPRAQEVADFILVERKWDNRNGETVHGTWIRGCSIRVHTFNGFGGYTEKAERKAEAVKVMRIISGTRPTA